MFQRTLDNEKFLFLFVPVAAFAFPHLFLVTGGYDRWIMPVPREIGYVENATALFFLIGAVYAFWLALRRYRPGVPYYRAALVFVGTASLWVCMEEISYGQQFLHFGAPEWFLEHNYNKEMNIHNLGKDMVSHAMRTGGYALVLVVGIIMPLWGHYRAGEFPKESFFYHFVPGVWLIAPSLFHLLANLPKNIIKSLPDGAAFVESHVYFNDSGEYEEYMFALWVILFLAMVHRRAKSYRYP